MLFALLLGCPMWRPVTTLETWGPTAHEPVTASPIEYVRCRQYYDGLGPTLDRALSKAEGAVALRDITVDQRWMGPAPTATGCIVIHARPVYEH